MASFGLKDIEDQLKEIKNKLITFTKEQTSGALLTIGYVHERAHAGNLYRGSHEWASVGNGETRNALIDVPSGTKAHIQLKGFSQTSQDLRIEFFSAPTIDTAGSALDATGNLNDEDNSAPGVTITQEVTTTDNGTLRFIGGSPGGQKAGGNATALPPQSGYEFHTAENKQYLLELTNLTTNEIDYIWFEIIWYEH